MQRIALKNTAGETRFAVIVNKGTVGRNRNNANGFGKRYIKNCKICGSEFLVMLSDIERTKCCSKECRFKYQKINRTGKHTKRFSQSEIISKGEYAIVKLKQGKEAIIDLDDIERIEGICWREHNNHSSRGVIGNIYAISSRFGGNKPILMHRLIMGAEKGQQIDHINHNSLDNRKSNLRFVTQTQNNLNKISDARKQYIGTTKCKSKKGGYYAHIKMNKKYKHIGWYPNRKLATEAYKRARVEIYGKEFAL